MARQEWRRPRIRRSGALNPCRALPSLAIAVGNPTGCQCRQVRIRLRTAQPAPGGARPGSAAAQWPR